MKNSNFHVEDTVKNIGGMVMGVLRDVGSGAWEELNCGIDKAWDEIKLGVDEGLNTAFGGFNRAWKEFSTGVDRAKEQLLDKHEGAKPRRSGLDKSASSSRTRKEHLT